MMDDQSEWKPIVHKIYMKSEQALTQSQNIWKDVGCTRERREICYKKVYSHLSLVHLSRCLVIH